MKPHVIAMRVVRQVGWTILDAEFVLTERTEQQHLGKGVFSGVHFELYPGGRLDSYTMDDGLLHWTDSAGCRATLYRDLAEVRLCDLRHDLRSMYLAASGDTDPTPTDPAFVLAELRAEMSATDSPSDIASNALRRWPDLNHDLIPHCI